MTSSQERSVVERSNCWKEGTLDGRRIGCDVCRGSNESPENQLARCGGCSITVHQGCYGILELQKSCDWYCQVCQIARPQCELCPINGGVLKKTDHAGWAHVVCAISICTPQLGIESKNSVTRPISPEHLLRNCHICELHSEGQRKTHRRPTNEACMRCHVTGCDRYFHATCAQLHSSLIVDAKGQLKIRGYCLEHRLPNSEESAEMAIDSSQEQAAKIDSVTDLENMDCETLTESSDDGGPNKKQFVDRGDTALSIQPAAKRLVGDAPLEQTTLSNSTSRHVTALRREIDKQELERTIINLMVSSLTSDGPLNVVSNRLNTSETRLGLYQQKVRSTVEKVGEMEKVLYKFVMQTNEERMRCLNPPRKIVRSVGLQVCPRVKTKTVSPLDPNDVQDPHSLGVVLPTATNTSPILASPSDTNKVSASSDGDSLAEMSADSSAVPVKNRRMSAALETPSPSSQAPDKCLTETLPPFPASPAAVHDPSLGPAPPKFRLQVSKVLTSLVVAWSSVDEVMDHATIESYRIWVYREPMVAKPSSKKWNLLTCRENKGSNAIKFKTDSELAGGARYHFIIRANGANGRVGPFSDPVSIVFP